MINHQKNNFKQKLQVESNIAKTLLKWLSIKTKDL